MYSITKKGNWCIRRARGYKALSETLAYPQLPFSRHLGYEAPCYR